MLNKEQKIAVEHQNGPILVVAGAGTGKTKVITERIANLVNKKGVKSQKILALTFTEKAASEMEERLDVLMPLGYEAIAVSTFHSFCEKTLRQYGIDIGISPGFKILEGVEQWKFLKDQLYNFKLDYYRPLGNPTKFIRNIVSFFGRLKEEIISPEAFLDFAMQKEKAASDEESQIEAKKYLELANVYKQYQGLMAESDYLDFSDLQSKLIELLRKRPNILKHLQEKYEYILVDEYQDTNIAQNEIVDLLAAKHRNLMVVGDDDQSIYKFRGAAISNILEFEEKYSELKKVVLTQNYRSNQRILDLAYTSIQKNNPYRLEVKSKINKKISGQKEGERSSVKKIHCSTIEQEVEYVVQKIKQATVPLSDIAILCRANSYAKPFLEALKKENIPYQFLSEKGLYNKEVIKDLIAILRTIANPRDDISLFRVLRMENWGLKMGDIIEIIAEAKKKHIAVWSLIQSNPKTKHLCELLTGLIEYSKDHKVGEVLFKYTEAEAVYEKLFAKGDIESEEKISNIASFFGRIQQFEKSHEEALVINYIDYLNLAEEAGENPSAKFDVDGIDGVQLSTIHASKGLEFHTVFLPSMVARRFPTDNRQDAIKMPEELIKELQSEQDFHLQEERRLFYVAVTRAKEELHLLHSDFYNPSSAASPRKKKPSIFIQEILEEFDFESSEIKSEGIERFLKPKESMMVQRQKEVKKKEILNFSHSALNTFESCPRKYEYSYILKIPQEMTGAASFGSSLHNTLNEFYKLVTQSKQASLFESYEADLSIEKLLEIYEEKWINLGFESLAQMKTLKKRGEDILRRFHAHFQEEVTRIAFLEKGFKLKAGKYTISGRIDRADVLPDGTLEVIDYKSGRAKKQKDVDNDKQLQIYALATKECFNQPSSKLTLYFLDDDLKVSTEPSEKKLDKLKEKLIETGDKINQSDFAPTPSKFVCGFCPYKKICDKAEL